MEENSNLPIEETSIFTCKVCQQQKVRTLVGKFNQFNKKYKDDKGTCNGLVCGSCHRERAKNNMRKLREKRKNASIPIE